LRGVVFCWAANVEGSDRVACGSTWVDSPHRAQVAQCVWWHYSSRFAAIGFRVAFDTPPTQPATEPAAPQAVELTDDDVRRALRVIACDLSMPVRDRIDAALLLLAGPGRDRVAGAHVLADFLEGMAVTRG